MNQLKEAAAAVLEALILSDGMHSYHKEIAALRAALAEQPAEQPTEQEPVAWQGRLDNEELLEWWGEKAPGVKPTDKELTAFALGVEVGCIGSHSYFLERNSARDAWRRAANERDKLRIALAERKEPQLTVDALRVEFEKRHRGTIGTTRIASGEYLSPAIETEWQQFVRKYTAPQPRKRLTDEEMRAALRPCFEWEGQVDEAMLMHIDEYRAIESAVWGDGK